MRSAQPGGSLQTIQDAKNDTYARQVTDSCQGGRFQDSTRIFYSGQRFESEDAVRVRRAYRPIGELLQEIDTALRALIADSVREHVEKLTAERDTAMLEVVRLRSTLVDLRSALVDPHHPLNNETFYRRREGAWVGMIDKVLGERIGNGQD